MLNAHPETLQTETFTPHAVAPPVHDKISEHEDQLTEVGEGECPCDRHGSPAQGFNENIIHQKVEQCCQHGHHCLWVSDLLCHQNPVDGPARRVSACQGWEQRCLQQLTDRDLSRYLPCITSPGTHAQLLLTCQLLWSICRFESIFSQESIR